MKTLIILAGGKSTRMGKDKVFLPLADGSTFLELLYRKAVPFFERIIISAGSPEHSREIAALLPDVEIVEDLYAEHYIECGPLGGIVSVWEKMGIERTAVVPVDVPRAEMQVLSFLFDQCTEQACVFQNDNGKIEPLIAAYPESVLERMQKQVRSGSYRVMAALGQDFRLFTAEELKQQIPELKEIDTVRAFSNINTENDYKELLR